MVNVGKTKVMKCEIGMGQVIKSGKWPCGICKEGVGRNSIKCTKCHKWIHKRCSKIKGKLKEDAQFQCSLCVLGQDTQSSVKGVGSGETVLGQDCELERVDRFCYLGDMLGSGGVQRRLRVQK